MEWVYPTSSPAELPTSALSVPPAPVNFAGLSASERRGQCALVVQAAEQRLREDEHFIVPHGVCEATAMQA